MFVPSFADFLISLISSSLTCVLFSCSVLVATLSNSPFLDAVIFLVKVSILLEEDTEFLSKSFLFIEGVRL